MKDGIGLKGKIEFKVFDKNGKLKEKREIDNLVVNAGLAAVAGLLLTDVTMNDFDYIALGTGTTPAVAGDTTLESEITTNGGSRVSGTGTRITTAVTNDTAQLVASYAFTGSLAITEAGIFNAASAGDMLARQVFAVINVGNGDTLDVTWTVQAS